MTTQNVENIYRLAPLQAGMLFHALYDTTDSNPYVAQSVDEYSGSFDVDRYRKAWETVVARHGILRTSFVWEGVPEPLQVVRRRVELPFSALDWRYLEEAEQDTALVGLLAEDRRRGFDLGTAPLLRLVVIRIADDRVVVVCSYHHMLLDGWSRQLVQQELAALYREPDADLPRPVQYARYVEWLGAQSAADAESFWRRCLDGFVAPTEIPVSRETGDSGFVQHEHALSEVDTERLTGFVRSQRLTVSTVAQAAWGLLLARYGNAQDVVFGSTVSGRPVSLAGVESMVGLLINTLPVRVCLPQDAVVGEWLRGIQDQHAELRQYEYSSLVDVQRWSSVPAQEPLFKSIFVFENYPGQITRDSGLDGLTGVRHLGVAHTGYPITVAVSVVEGRLEVTLAYDRSLFDSATIERLAGHFENLLLGLLDADARLADLGLVVPAEAAELTEWGRGRRTEPPVVALPALFEAHADASPDAVAVVAGAESLTYGALNERANRLAHHLISCGAGRGSFVGVCLDRGLDVVVALLAVLKSGAAYVPLDPEYPADRLELMLADSGTAVVVTRDALAGRVSGDGRLLVAVDTDGDLIAAAPAENPEPGIIGGDTAYVIYTSGSTGVPKGVVVPHEGVVDRLIGVSETYGFGPGDVWTIFHSFSFDLSVWEMWGALAFGGRAVVVNAAVARNVDMFLDLLIDEQVTVLCQTPSAFYLFMSAITPEFAEHTSLRLITMGGEAFHPAKAARWFATFGQDGPVLLNMYGITEGTIHVTEREISPEDMVRGGSPVGRSLANTDVFVVDGAGNQVPVGVTGELWVAGAGLADGYLNRPELTAERFVRREFAGQAMRLYRSGDFVRWTADGELDYVGRADDQVKIRGYRIELGEVESIIAKSPDVDSCVVVLREDVPGAARIVAYCVTPESSSVTRLREWCAQSLPAYMIPSGFVFLDALPLTSNGKVNKAALPAPGVARPRLDTNYLAPRNPREEVLVEVLREVLAIDQVGVHDNFFELGGDSIVSIQVVARAKNLGVLITPRMIFRHQTVAAIAAEAQETEEGVVEQRVRLEPGSYGLAPLQAGMLFHSLYEASDDASPYVVQFVDELTGPVDLDGLRRAWETVLARHTILRSAFEWEGLDEPRQVVRDEVTLPFIVLDWSSEASSDQQSALDELLAEDRVRGFDVAVAPLVRITVARLGEERHAVLWTFHHLLLDGWSAQVVLREVFACYSAGLTGREAALAEPTDYVRYMEWLAGQSRTAAQQYWRTRLAGFTEPTPLGVDQVTGDTGFADFAAALDMDLSSRIREFAREQRITANTVVHAAYGLLLARYSGLGDVVFGSTVSGRPAALAGVESMVGLFINTLPVRVVIPPDVVVGEWLRGLQDEHAELRQYEYSPLVDVQRWSSVPAPSPLFKSIFAFENFPRIEAAALPDGLRREPRRDVERTGYPLTVAVTFSGAELELNIAYDRAVLDLGTIERMVEHFATVLTELLDGNAVVVDVGAEVGLPIAAPQPVVAAPAEIQAAPVVRQARPELDVAFEAPRDEVETVLARIWCDVLHLAEIGIRDNFFELGGDSILSIQIVSRARRHGLRITPRLIFEHENIAAINENLDDSGLIAAEQGPVVGDVPLGAVQRWFLEQEFADRNLFNQTRLIQVDDLDAGLLERALIAVAEHHDALRLRLVENAGEWRLHAVETPQGPPVRYVDLRGLADADRRAGMVAAADDLNALLDVSTGPVLAACLVDSGGEHGTRLLLVAHHLVVDALSWSVLVEDIAAACQALSAGTEVRLPLKTTSFRDWTERLATYAVSPGAAEDVDYWCATTASSPLPRDHTGNNTFGSVDAVHARLTEEETSAVLRHTPGAFGVRMNDVLVTAVTHAACEWSGSDAVTLDLEGHGREDLFPDVDLTRTVGWFTSLFPVHVERTEHGPASASLPLVAKQLAAVPHNGVTYGVLRYLGPEDVRSRLAAHPAPELSFNYLGGLSGGRCELGHYASTDEPTGRSVDPAAIRAHLIDIVASVEAGELQFTAFFSDQVHDAASVQCFLTDVVVALRDMVRSGKDRIATTELPSSGAEVALLPLSPMQTGMLFHSLDEDAEVIPYLAQFVDEYDGDFDADYFLQAWQQVVNRHQVLRSGFLWQGLPEPVQAVYSAVRLPHTLLDWTDCPADEQERRFDELLAADREQYFDLSSAPLLRVAVIRMAGSRHRVLWTFHHLLLDGWSAQLVQSELIALYRAAVLGTEAQLDEPVPYSDYVDWLAEQPVTESERFWRHTLAGLTAPTPFGIEEQTGKDGYGDLIYTIDGAALSEFAQAQRVTVNTLVQGAWALLLSRYSGLDDVTFGVVVSGRPTELAGAEAAVGPFINTIPARVDVPADDRLKDWLGRLQTMNVNARQYGHCSLVRIKSWSDVPRREQLFRSMIVFENYPRTAQGSQLPDGVTRRRLRYVERVGYPLVLGVEELGDHVHLHLNYQRALFTDAAIDRLSGHLRNLLGAMVRDPEAPLRRVDMLTAAPLTN
jgi:amino acid adenylation domain-containing protein/non-ribosomal peptide synthase protein (TIGR01720 family)